MPWRLLNNEIIKIDSRQFEQDLINKYLLTLKSIQAVEPLFQNAYSELLESIQFFSKSDYKNAIFFAEKSYESVLKVVTGGDNGQAQSLISKLINADWFNDLPIVVSKKGFADNVLSGLPYIRNQTKVGHGEGGEKIEISPALARLSINLNCSLSSYILDVYSVKHLARKNSGRLSIVPVKACPMPLYRR